MPGKAKPPKITPSLTPDPAPDPASWQPSKRARIAALGVIAVVVVVLAVLIVGTGGKSSPASTQVTVKAVGPVLVTASGLKTLAKDLNQVIYWVGPVAGDKYEFSRSTTDDVYVRYLPRGVKVGTHEGKYPLVATYPFAGALDALVADANGQLLTVAGGKGGLAAVERGKRTNVRVAFPGVDYQIEVYDPSAKEARRFATSAALAPLQ